MYYVCVTVHNVLLLSHCLIASSFMYFVLCYVLIVLSFLIIRFMFVVLVCTFCFLFLRVLCFCIVSFVPVYRVVYLVFLYNSTVQCHRVETQLQLINITSYIISYIISHHIIYHIIPYIIYHIFFIIYNMPRYIS